MLESQPKNRQIPEFQHFQQNRNDRYSHDNPNKQQNSCHHHNRRNRYKLTFL